MDYVILVAADPTGWSEATLDQRQASHAAHIAFERAVAANGRKLAGAALADADTATTLRATNGQWAVTDGPFVELTEQIGGFYLVDLPDLDTVISVAKLLPQSYAVEIRPTLEIEGYDPT
ncbi:MAG: YciI family protein [Nostocoides sp.]